MPDDANADNPYTPPMTGDERFGMARHTFYVGRNEIHAVCVETSIWTGLRTHTVDAAGNVTPAQRGTCRFRVGNEEQHEVEIQVDKVARINARVDGEVVEHNMFPRVRILIFAMIAVFMLVITVMFIGIIFANKFFNL